VDIINFDDVGSGGHYIVGIYDGENLQVFVDDVEVVVE